MKHDFLNSKNYPSISQIINLFFDEKDANEAFHQFTNQLDSPNFISEIDEDKLEIPKNKDIFEGIEWTITKLSWNDETGPVFKILVEKNDVTDINYTTNMTNDSDFNPFFPYRDNEETEQTKYIDINPLSFQEQLDNAIELENFEEALRLRDWNTGLITLLLDLKPKIIKAIEDADLDTLDLCTRKIEIYRINL